MYVCRPICYRRKLLEENIKEVANHITLSEQTLIKVKWPYVSFSSNHYIHCIAVVLA